MGWNYIDHSAIVKIISNSEQENYKDLLKLEYVMVKKNKLTYIELSHDPKTTALRLGILMQELNGNVPTGTLLT